MAICKYCGDALTFRFIGGRCIPLHGNGSCGYLSGGGVNNFTSHSHAPQSACFLTNCPACRAPVFFVRHNGGSVWLDSPLGPPWAKHECFNNGNGANAQALESVGAGFFERSKGEHGDSAGVVRYARYFPEKSITQCILETGSSGACLIDIKNSAGFLLGRLCVINKVNKKISPFDFPDLAYSILRIKKTGSAAATYCHICTSEIHANSLAKHLEKKHGLS
jgi:hypothetical protein